MKKGRLGIIISGIVVVAIVLLTIFVPPHGNFPISSVSTITRTVSNLSDYEFFIQPNLARIELLREWFMAPYDFANAKPGYDQTYGMIRGGYWDGSFRDGFVLIDTQLLAGRTLDYLNAQKGTKTSIGTNMEKWLSNSSFIDPATGQNSTYNGTDRREILFGKILSCVNHDSGQIFYVPGKTLSDPPPSITTSLPTNCSSPGGAMNYVAEWIELYYLEGKISSAQNLFEQTLNGWTSTNGTGIGGSTGGYFNDTLDSGPDQGKCKSSRALGYWIEMARATGFWDLNDQSRSVAQQAMNELWAHQNSQGGISVNYPGCKNDLKSSGESGGITLLAFDPRVPSWFQSGTNETLASAVILVPISLIVQMSIGALVVTSITESVWLASQDKPNESSTRMTKNTGMRLPLRRLSTIRTD